MNRKIILAILLIAVIGVAAFLSDPVQTQIAYARMPAPVDRTVSWTEDVKPVLDRSCRRCHGGDARKGKFQYDTPERFIAGGKSGAAAVAGDSRESLIVKALVHFPGVEAMPRPGSTAVTREEIAALRAWIDQGMKFDDAADSAPTEPN